MYLLFRRMLARVRFSAPTKPRWGAKTFLDGSEKAAAQWELEKRFGAFEAKF